MDKRKIVDVIIIAVTAIVAAVKALLKIIDHIGKSNPKGFATA